MTRLALPSPPRLDVARFAAIYTAEVNRCLDRIFPQLPPVLPPLQGTVRGDRGERKSIYFLGNGGSSAIARTLALAAETIVGSVGPRWVGAWDQYRLAAESTRHGFDVAAVNLLQRDGADRRDLVVLISGSGNSRNLVAVARHCRARGIPLLTITGRGGGALAPLDPHGLRIDSTDQQIVEDVAHIVGISLLQLLAAPGASPAVINRTRADVAKAVTIDQSWMSSLADAAGRATACGGCVVILAPEGGGISLSAEHTAHNLRWDLTHDLSREDAGAHLRVVDGTSLCDDTGMTNDTGKLGLPVVRLVDDVTDHDLVLIFADDPDHPAVRPVRAVVASRGLGAFGCYRNGVADQSDERVWRTGVSGPLAAVTAQSVGHLLLRSLRAATLLQANGDRIDLGCAEKAWQPVAPQLARPLP